MRLVKQRKRIHIDNKDDENEVQAKRARHSALLPNNIRSLVCGASNCGKTNVVLCLILDPNGLRFEHVNLYSKTPFQQKYVFLGKVLSEIEGITYNVFYDTSSIVKPQDAKRNSIFIFDDVACDKQNVMREYFAMGRHSGVDCFYLCQSYTRIPKQLIRDNANLLILFRQDESNMKHVYDDHVNTDMSFEDFKEMCTLCWKNDKYGFLVINKDSEPDGGRYRKGFDTYIKR